MPDTVMPTPPEDTITIDEFRLMVDIRVKALEIAIKAPKATSLSAIFKTSEEIERWLTRKLNG